ncbi:hypothetical protein llap_11787 [Limosa lapponica baueri]|uniref:ribonuclease H n=1 Tax=Limosa lapponica baueri TaxID=1758121 RepID=A0A2I0TVR4_LIMLA|nr:hypothetical protein llap_11787 [Limosa lapponica baueri]
MELDGAEARQLGNLSKEAGIDKALGEKSQTLSLWRRLLSAIKDRYPFKDDIECCPSKWTNIEKGIKYLRELAVKEVIYGDWDKTVNPDEMPCKQPMLRKFSRSAPPMYSHTLSVLIWAGVDDDSLTRVKEQQVPIATATVHRGQYPTNRDSLIPIQNLIRRPETQGVITKTRSPFNSPIWPVRKSDRDRRLTVAYHGLSEVTPPLSAAVPDTLELHYELESKAAKCCATTDIANAFFSIPLAAERRPQFAFSWRGVQYTWNRLPQGWKHSPAICHGLIQTALGKGGAPNSCNASMTSLCGVIQQKKFSRKVIYDSETCAEIEQAKRLKPLWYGGRWLKYKYGEAWQIDYITVPQTRQGKCYVLTMVEGSTGWLETYAVPHATAQNTILGLENQVLWRHGTPERIESDNGTHFKNNLLSTWAKEHGIEWAKANPFVGLFLPKDLDVLGGGCWKMEKFNVYLKEI